MTTPKNPEEIINSAQTFIMEDDSGLEIREKFYALPDYWLRSSMASLLLWASEQIKLPCEDEVFYDKDGNDFKNPRTLLANEAKKLSNV